MNITKDQWTGIARAILICILAICSIAGYDIAIVQPREAAIAARAEPLTRGVSHFTEIEAETLKAAAPTAVGTATPALMVDSAGVSVLFEVRDAQTPVFTVNDGGAVSWPSSNIRVAGPTALATTTPALIVDNLGVGNLIEVRDAATPVWYVADGGAVTGTGALSGASATIGGGYGSTGCTLSTAGVLQCDGAATTDGALTAASAVITAGATFGGGYESTGCSISTAGLLQCDDAITTDSTLTANVGTITTTLNVDGTSNLDEVDIDGVTNLIVGTEHIGVPSIISTAITYTAAAGGTGAVTTIADGEVWFVHAVFVNVTTDFDCTGDDTTLVIGDGADPNGFVDLADAELQAADTEQTGSPAGWQGLVAATMGVYLDGAVSSAPHIYAPSGAAETIDWLLDEASGETITAGAATIYVAYTRIS